jgi:hypothetical protein
MSRTYNVLTNYESIQLLLCLRFWFRIQNKYFQMNIRDITFETWALPAKPKYNKKKWRYYFLFILVRTTTKSIQFTNKPVFLLLFFPCWYFAFISKAATIKIVNLYTISVCYAWALLTREKTWNNNKWRIISHHSWLT